jgi:ribonuclease HI
MMMTIYSDGLGIERAAYNSVISEASHQYLRSEMLNIYIAELTAVYLAIKQLRNHCECRICRIYIDSQAAIKAIDQIIYEDNMDR